MSIEQTIAANTAALTAQTAAMEALVAVYAKLTAQAKNVVADVQAGKTAGVTLAAVKHIEVAPSPKPVATPVAVVTATATPEVIAPAEPAAASLSDTPAVVEMKDLSAAVTAAATRNREGLVALLGKHNVKRASELPQDKWAGLVAELEAL